MHQECTQQSQAVRDGALPNWRLPPLPNPLIAAQTYSEEEEEEEEKPHRQTEMDRKLLWQYLHFDFTWPQSVIIREKKQTELQTEIIHLSKQNNWPHVVSYNDLLLHISSLFVVASAHSDVGLSSSAEQIVQLTILIIG